MQIRSYSDAFRQNRTIYGGWARHLPNGLPISQVIYTAAFLIVVLTLDHIIITHELLGIVSPFMRYIVIPIGIAYLMFNTRVDGRPAHVACWHILLMRLRPERTVNGKRVKGYGKVHHKLQMRADTDWTRMPRASIQGPADLRFGQPVKFHLSWRRHWIAKPGGKVTDHHLSTGERLEVKR